MDSYSTLSSVAYSWEEDPKFILRGWSLVFSILATLLGLSVVDGRLAYLQGSYTGYLGIWIDCGRHKCANLGQVTVLIHMSMGFMMLALTLCLFLLLAMGLSFRPGFKRLSKIDLVFSSLSFSIGALNYFNHLGMWSQGTAFKERRVSYRRWASQQKSQRRESEQPSTADRKHTVQQPHAVTSATL
ncbi:uncharacterized protein [Canis lupus baileyi]|uniref:uncharacterized protein LOC102153804 isoform X3 n=1 Tax=Canis lupus familiaris TaxID=9615 RepID=UPI000BAA1815|nr:uncharacterized protein LOC102153804 isoform X3 [Canis lupus familiaris]XP_025279902.1 uncharacterized protein LOC112645081 isoform X5 [Canis lupus dingo]XP_038383981.1 uncharacterized protein LOC102153804 isoform X3 [Canis lupus familiaris]XP_038512077.1 uncharacterized protein LOC102153804 isoform X3 [Canis lupus familiaris]XP_048964669.1 uncharacterized protein LOC112645081 isoform X6 [Canis lupus dingo]|eukprot:XP_022278916.1 uncharacterized protein LOC102153804 isoform X3 [Canis lupus familiaris]